jgi:ketosteroid isomerase-like protein
MIDQSQIDLSATNERSVHDIYDAERRRDIEAWAALWHEEGRQTFPFSPTTTVAGRDRVVAVTQRKFDVRPPYEIRVVTEPFADPHRILARLHLIVPGGPPSEVHIWCIFHFDDAGMITEVEEMLDTAAALEVSQ